MNRYQTKANEVYADDLVQLYADYPEGDYGDTLAEFIAAELGDAASDSEAAGFMNRAIEELSFVRNALQNGT